MNWTKTPPTTEGYYWFVATETYGSMMLLEVIYSQLKNPGAPAVLCAVTPQGYMWPVNEPRGYWWPERVERPPDGPTWENGRYVFKGAGMDVELELTG
jgi:hypothetical protein